jgi:ribokinase
MMKTLVFGSLNIDLIFPLDHIVRPGETISSTGMIRSAGGKGANQAAALAKAGLDVYMAGKIGADGRFLLELLHSYGVDTSAVIEYDGATGQAIIQVDKNGQNSIVLYAGGNGLVASEEIRSVLARFDPGDILVLQNEIAGLKTIMETAVQKGMMIYFNPSPYDRGVEALPLEGVNAFFVNELEAAAMTQTGPEEAHEKKLELLLGRFPKAEIILTAGKDGAWYGGGKLRERADIVDAPVVDTTGAGDTFSGYFIASRVRGFSPAEALRTASRAASIAVSRRGAMEAVPLAAEVF